MKMKNKGNRKKIIVLALSVLMALATIGAASAMPADWDQMVITLEWTDAWGNLQSATAKPIYEAEGSYWAFLPADAPLYGLTFRASHPWHTYTFLPADGSLLENVTDAMDQLSEETGYTNFVAMEPGATEFFKLYISTWTETPTVTTAGQELPPEGPEMPPEGQALPPVDALPPQPEYITPEPVYATPEPEYITPEPVYATPEPEYTTPEPVYNTPEQELPPAPVYMTPEPETITPEPVYNTPEQELPPAPVYMTPEPEMITPEPVYTTPEPYEDVTISTIGDMYCYGVTTAKVRFRAGMSTETAKLADLKNGQIVYLIENRINDAGEAWCYVNIDGTQGYVMTQFLRKLTSWENEAVILERGIPEIYTPAPEITPVPITPEPAYITPEPEYITPEPEIVPPQPAEISYETTPVPLPGDPITPEPEYVTPEPEIITPTPTAPPTPTPTATAEPMTADMLEEGTFINQYGVTKVNVNVRAGAGSGTAKRGSLHSGQYVYMVQTLINEKGENWTKVLYNGKECFIKSEFLYMISEGESEEYAVTQPQMPIYTATPEPTATPTEVPTPTPTEVPTPTPTDVPTPTPTDVPTPTPTEEPTPTPTEEPTPTEVPTPTPTEEPTPTPTEVPTPTPTEEPTATPTETPTPTPTPTEVPTAEPVEIGEMLNRYAKTNRTVNFRKEPDSSSARVKQLKAGKYVYMILQELTEQDEEWTYVLVDGKTGYIKSEFLDPLRIAESDAYNWSQSSPAPFFTMDDLYTETPPQPTLETTPEPTVEDTPTPEPTPTEVPTATPAPTETPTPTPEPTAASTEEPPQRIGYAITIGDGAYVRNWPSSNSVIIDALAPNKVVRVNGQEYDVDGVPWHVVSYDGTWGYIRADMIRMLNDVEVMAYLTEAATTIEPALTQPTITAAPTYNPRAMSCYGYVSADSVNFRGQPTMQSERLGQLKRYALCIIYDREEIDGTVWFKVGYNGTIGYVNGNYFQQMTAEEAEDFFRSEEYLEGLENNRKETQQESRTDNTSPRTTGTPSGIVSAEDQQIATWKNPENQIQVSYEPFDPFATQAPLEENEIRNREYLDSLAERIVNGSLKEENLQKMLEIAYQDKENKDAAVAEALAYVRDKIGATATEAPPTGTPTPIPQLATEENNDFEKEEKRGGSPIGWIIGGLMITGGLGGGGYYLYNSRQKKRKAVQRMAQNSRRPGGPNGYGGGAASNGPRFASNRTGAAGMNGSTGAGNTENTNPPVSAQQAARVRTGTYTERDGSTTVRPNAASMPGNTSGAKAYSKPMDNPIGRYRSSGTEEDASYTASFKPAEPREGGTPRRRRNNNTSNGNGDA